MQVSNGNKMAKTLYFTDAHRFTRPESQKLLSYAQRNNIDNIVFLGDLDGYIAVKTLLELRTFANRAGIGFDFVLGNHDVYWRDYATHVSKRPEVDHGKPDPSQDRKVRTDPAVREFYTGPQFITSPSLEVLCTHAFPMGKIISDSQTAKYVNLNPQRAQENRGYWHGSFGTNITTGQGKHQWDYEVLGWNFDAMQKQGFSRVWRPAHGYSIMVKGHEHTNRCWTRQYGGQRVNALRGGADLHPRTEVNINPNHQYIFQIRDYTKRKGVGILTTDRAGHPVSFKYDRVR